MPIPNNIADAASAIKDGTFGLIDVVKIGDLIVSSLSGLAAPREIIPTRKAIEDGYEITDAAVTVPRELIMNVVLANPEFSVEAGLTAAMSGGISGFLDTWRDKKDYLEKLQDDRELVEVQTHEGVYPSMLVRTIDPIYDIDFNADAFIATVYMDEIRVISTGVGGLIDSAKQTVSGL